jgi:hypothetical protein
MSRQKRRSPQARLCQSFPSSWGGHARFRTKAALARSKTLRVQGEWSMFRQVLERVRASAAFRSRLRTYQGNSAPVFTLSPSGCNSAEEFEISF